MFEGKIFPITIPTANTRVEIIIIIIKKRNTRACGTNRFPCIKPRAKKPTKWSEIRTLFHVCSCYWSRELTLDSVRSLTDCKILFSERVNTLKRN